LHGTTFDQPRPGGASPDRIASEGFVRLQED
jgi:hypothetical protein